jgi:DTW domain-containing protein YfiP
VRCRRCRRAASVCYCAHLATIESRTHVVFLQHPKERRVAIGTARLAHLALPNSELHIGLAFADHPVSARLTAGAALLFPGDDALDPATLSHCLPRTLVVLDGTWSQARKLLGFNPALRALPRIGLVPTRPSRYAIRREPAAHCLSTVEAVVETLGRLEGDATRFLPVLHAFDHLVATQVVCAAERSAPHWHRRRAALVDPPRRAARPLRAP